MVSCENTMKTSTLDLRLPYLTDVWHRNKLIEFFFEIYNVGNKSLCREEQNKFCKKSYPQWGLKLGLPH